MTKAVKFTENGLKICSTCKTIESIETIFRPRRNQCINCINNVRRIGHKRKISIELSILFKKKYKKEYYINNKINISEESKKRYLSSRESRLANASARYYNVNHLASNLIRSIKRRAKLSQLDFDLDIDFIDEMYKKQNGKCALTGIEFVFEKSNTSKRPFAPSIDRIDSSKGYIKNNVRIVCVIVNFALNEFGDIAFDAICKAYVKNTVCCK